MSLRTTVRHFRVLHVLIISLTIFVYLATALYPFTIPSCVIMILVGMAQTTFRGLLRKWLAEPLKHNINMHTLIINIFIFIMFGIQRRGSSRGHANVAPVATIMELFGSIYPNHKFAHIIVIIIVIIIRLMDLHMVPTSFGHCSLRAF